MYGYVPVVRWLLWRGTAYAVPQYPAVPDFVFVAPSDEKTVIGLKVHSFFDAINDILFARFILLDEWEEREARQDFGGEKVNVYFDELGLGEGRLKIEVSQ
jgi:hypothetical protein